MQKFDFLLLIFFAQWFIVNGAPKSVCCDPLFDGLDGHHYNFQGEPNKVFALISDPFVQINSRFVTGHVNGTALGDICVRFCQSTAVFTAGGAVTLSGPVTQQLVVQRLANLSAVVTAGAWKFEVQQWGPKGSFHNLMSIQLQQSETLSGHIHGVFGVTAPHSAQQSTVSAVKVKKGEKKHCQPSNEGGCEVPGDWHEYEIVDGGKDLCSTRFKYSQFDTKGCAAVKH